MSADQNEDFGTQVIQPLLFRYPTAWLSWQAILGDLAARGNPDARLSIEAVGSADATSWTAEIEWGTHHERVGERPSLPAALLDLWHEIIAHHALREGDLSQRGPGVYEPHECLDVETQAVFQRLLSIVRSGFGADWAVLITYHPVLQSDQRVVGRVIARQGEVAVSAGGASLIEAARALMRATTPFFPKMKPVRG